jgi:hypothetical protein
VVILGLMLGDVSPFDPTSEICRILVALKQIAMTFQKYRFQENYNYNSSTIFSASIAHLMVGRVVDDGEYPEMTLIYPVTQCGKSSASATVSDANCNHER